MIFYFNFNYGFCYATADQLTPSISLVYEELFHRMGKMGIIINMLGSKEFAIWAFLSFKCRIFPLSMSWLFIESASILRWIGGALWLVGLWVILRVPLCFCRIKFPRQTVLIISFFAFLQAIFKSSGSSLNNSTERMSNQPSKTILDFFFFLYLEGNFWLR